MEIWSRLLTEAALPRYTNMSKYYILSELRDLVRVGLRSTQVQQNWSRKLRKESLTILVIREEPETKEYNVTMGTFFGNWVLLKVKDKKVSREMKGNRNRLKSDREVSDHRSQNAERARLDIIWFSLSTTSAFRSEDVVVTVQGAGLASRKERG